VPSGNDAGEVVASTAKPPEGRGDVADRARLVHRIAKAFQRMGVDGGQVRLRMHPDDLGSVQLDMQISGRKVSATVTADNEEARLLLQGSLPELRQRLESQGLTVERLEVEKRAEEENRGFSNRDSSHQQSGYEQSSGRRDDLWGRSTLARANSIAANRRDYSPETAVQGVPAPLAASGGIPLNRSLDLQL
jgi:flagellar hook-length control protein FliK